MPFCWVHILGQRLAICLPLVDTDRQVFNMIVSNVNILNYFPVDLMPGLVTTELKHEHLKATTTLTSFYCPQYTGQYFTHGKRSTNIDLNFI